MPRSCHEGMWDSGDLSPHIPNLNFPPLPFVHSPFFHWMCSRMSPRIKQDASQIHIEHRKYEVWEQWSTLNYRLCHKPIPSTWQCDSLLIPNFECDSVLTLKSILLQLHDSATQHYLKCQNPKITSNVTLSRIISIGTRDFRFSYVGTEVLLILWCWLPNFISIKKLHTKLH